MKATQMLMMLDGFQQYGLYTKAEINDLINIDGYIPVATANELNSLRNTTSQTMGLGTMWKGTYTTGIDKKYVQIVPIDLTSIGSFTPIASFTGTYDGNEVLISNLSVSSTANNLGLFALVTDGALDNIRLSGTITGTGTGGARGGLAGGISGTTVVTNCQFSGTVSSLGIRTGGLIGLMSAGTVTLCASSGTVTSTGNSTGGFVGEIAAGTITQSYSTADVDGDGLGVGGFCGIDNSSATIEQCYALGDVTNSVTNNFYYGGFIGRVDGTINNCYARGSVSTISTYNGGFTGRVFATGAVTNSYSIGNVSGLANDGGFNGLNNGTITNCYWDTTTSIATSSGGTGKTTTEMQQGSIPDITIYIGWSALIWDPVDNSSYPILL